MQNSLLLEILTKSIQKPLVKKNGRLNFATFKTAQYAVKATKSKVKKFYNTFPRCVSNKYIRSTFTTYAREYVHYVYVLNTIHVIHLK